MKFSKRKHLNTIEAYSCNSTCYGCTILCNPSSCPCDTIMYDNPFDGLTSQNTGGEPQEEVRYNQTIIGEWGYK